MKLLRDLSAANEKNLLLRNQVGECAWASVGSGVVPGAPAWAPDPLPHLQLLGLHGHVQELLWVSSLQVDELERRGKAQQDQLFQLKQDLTTTVADLRLRAVQAEGVCGAM